MDGLPRLGDLCGKYQERTKKTWSQQRLKELIMIFSNCNHINEVQKTYRCGQNCKVRRTFQIYGQTELPTEGVREEVGYRDAYKDEYLEYRLRFFEFVLLYPEELHKYVPP